MRNSIWCLLSQVLTGSPVCQTRAKFPRLSLPLSLPSCLPIRAPHPRSVCLSDPREEAPAEKHRQFLFSSGTPSVCAPQPRRIRDLIPCHGTAACHPFRLQCGGYLAAPIRRHPPRPLSNSRRHVRPFSRAFLHPPRPLSRRLFIPPTRPSVVPPGPRLAFANSRRYS